MIPSNDHTFNMVMKAMFGCDMKNHFISFFEMVQEEEITLFPSRFELNSFPSKQ
jgi:hypothetical protein